MNTASTRAAIIAGLLSLIIFPFQNCAKKEEAKTQSASTTQTPLPLIITDGCSGRWLDDSNLRWILCPITIQNTSAAELTGVSIKYIEVEPAIDLTTIINCDFGSIGPGETRVCNVDLTGGTSDIPAAVKYKIVTNLGTENKTFDIQIRPHELPSTIAGLVLWLRADTMADLEDGAPVAEWYDVSGKGNNGSQTNPNLQPVFVKSAFNNKPAVWFDGTNDFITIADSESLWPSQLTVVTVASFDVAATTRRQFLLSKIASPDWHSFGLFAQNNGLTFTVQDSVSMKWPIWSRGLTIQANRPYVLQGSFQTGAFNASDGSSRVDGAAGAGFTANAYSAGFQIEYTSGALELGRSVNASGNGGSHLLGNIAEVLIFERNLTAVEKKNLDTYLGAKYGISVPL